LRAQAFAAIDAFQETSSIDLQYLEPASIALSVLTAQYEVVLQLAGMLRNGSGFSPEPGSLNGPGLFFPMHEIFEKAVYNCIRACALQGYVLYQPSLTRLVEHVSGIPNITVSMRPDIALSAKPTAFFESRSHSRLVIDAKYKTPTMKTQYRTAFRNQDIYQVMSYGQALSCPGLLIYPSDGEEIDVVYRIGQQTFRIITVDLDDPTLRAFRRRLQEVLIDDA
jgi:5-methylcytosine-specific restriction endonuclease McrBC regulatory subunit McrC